MHQKKFDPKQLFSVRLTTVVQAAHGGDGVRVAAFVQPAQDEGRRAVLLPDGLRGALVRVVQLRIHEGRRKDLTDRRKKSNVLVLLLLTFRASNVLFGGECRKCDCNGHSTSCDAFTFECGVSVNT